MITNDNYQEFFLLYIDKELSAADRHAVEQWVAANPHLQEEWETLLQCRLLPEHAPVFHDKLSLLRSSETTAGGCGEDNYYEYLLSYVDGELDSKDRIMLETFLRKHPSKLAELEQLRQTVSHPDRMILFPDKDSLYRKEKDRRAILLYRTLIGAAAAALLGAVALLLLRGDHRGEPVIVKQAPVPSNKKDTSAVTPATTTALYPTEDREPGRQEARSEVLTKEHQEKKGPAPIPSHGTSIPSRGASVPSHVASIPSPVAPASSPAQKEERTLAVLPPVDLPEKTPADDRMALEPASNRIKTAAEQVNIPREHSSFATQALLLENNEKEIIASTEPASPGKSKLRGLFRKVSRTFGKTADRDTEGKREVLISAFQVTVN